MQALTPFRSLIFCVLGALAACANANGGTFPAKPDREVFVDPSSVIGDYLQGRFAADTEDYAVAADAFSRAAAEGASLPVQLQAFRYALAAGQFSEAVTYAEALKAARAAAAKAQMADPEADTGASFMHDRPTFSAFVDTDLPRLTLIADAFRREDIAAAETLLVDPFESPFGEVISALLDGWVVFEQEGAEAAQTVLSDAPAETRGGFEALHLALMNDIEGNQANAEFAYSAALQGPGANMAIVGLAYFNERNADRETALEFYHSLSEDRSFLRRLGRMGLVRLGEPLEGETRAFERNARATRTELASTTAEGAALAFLSFAWATYESSMEQARAAADAGFGDFPVNLEGPLALAQLAVGIDADLDAAHYIVGAVANYNRDWQRVLNAASNVSEQSWLYNYAVIDQIDALMALEREDEAIRVAKNYLREDALAPDVYLTLSGLLMDQGDEDAAIDAAGQAIRVAETLSADNERGGDVLWRYYFNRGALNTEADRWPEGEADLRKALEFAPEEAVVLNYLGYSYVERGLNLDEALEMIEAALDARPTSGAITDSLGWAYYQMGDYEMAIEYLERAVSLEPGDDTLTDHLGDAYWHAGRKKEARFEWRRILEMDNAEEGIRQSAEEKLGGVAPPAGSLASDR